MTNKTLVSVLLIAITITLIGSVNARTTRPLTDTEMAAIHGGEELCGWYWDCDVIEDPACADTEYMGDCSGSDNPNVPDPWPGGSGGCAGGWMTTCLQYGQAECVEGDVGCPCYQFLIDCAGSYEQWYCTMQDEECQAYKIGTNYCKYRNPGKKQDCYVPDP